MDGSKEIWRPINGYENYYEVSNLGRVKGVERTIKHKNSNRKISEKIMKPIEHSHGYYNVELSKNGKRKKHFVHRLVLLAFLENPDSKPCVNHINEDKKDNRLENLNWMTYRENNHYSNVPQRQAAYKRKKVYQYDLNGFFLKSYESIISTKDDGFSPSGVSKCCNGGSKKYKNYKWSYERR